jgi:hypothetical protein
MRPAALRALADAADALSRLAREAADGFDSDDALIPVLEASHMAATSVRVLRKAIRVGALPGYGSKRDRAVRRGDLLAWIMDRRMPVLPGPDDDDIARRMHRLAREQASTPRGSSGRRLRPQRP